jgi:hypothetical protein
MNDQDVSFSHHDLIETRIKTMLWKTLNLNQKKNLRSDFLVYVVITEKEISNSSIRNSNPAITIEVYKKSSQLFSHEFRIDRAVLIVLEVSKTGYMAET